MRYLFIIFLFFLFNVSFKADEIDREYLATLCKETWNGISFYVTESGLPIDNSLSLDAYTSVTNIGLYLASVASASDMKYITRENAINRISKVFDCIEQFQKWNGFPHSWNHTRTFKIHDEAFVSTVDLGNYYAGLLVARGEFPELYDRITRHINEMRWESLFDNKKNALYGGYNTKKNEYGNWYYEYLASDSLLALFFVTALGIVPSDYWDNLKRGREKKYGVEYYLPSWTSGGLFMQYLPGIFLDEWGTNIGKSAVNFAYAQMIHAEVIGYDVWGWSASVDPDGGYLGWGGIKDEVITPHAAILPVRFFPKECIENLKNLEALGIRKSVVNEGKIRRFGFRDAVNMTSGKVSEDFLCLDQMMIFLSLVNFLDDKYVIKTFKKDPISQNGYKRINELNPSMDEIKEFEQYLTDLSRQDKKAIAKQYRNQVFKMKLPASVTIDREEVISIDGTLEGQKTLFLSSENSIEQGDIENDNDLSCDVYLKKSNASFYVGLRVYDDELLAPATAQEIYTNDCVEIYIDPDADGLVWGDPNEYQLGFSPSKTPYAWFQNEDPSSKLNYIIKELSDGYILEVELPFANFKLQNKDKFGLSIAVHDLDSNTEGKLNWHFKGTPAKLATIYLKQETIKDIVAQKLSEQLELEPNSLQISTDNGSSLKINKIKDGFEMDYDLGTGFWVQVWQDKNLNLKEYTSIKLKVAMQGEKNRIEIKLVDSDGTNFGYNIE
ncbi:MAG: glucoamylase family protein, partial [Candidatus Hydrogenedentota bacterium]